MSHPPDERAKTAKRAFIFGLLVLLSWFGVTNIRQEARPAIELLPFPTNHTPNIVTAYFRNWGWRVKRFILPNQRVVDIQGVLFATTNGTSLQVPTTLITTNVFLETNGIRIVLLPKTELRRISHQMEGDLNGEILARPRVVTADGERGAMFVGSSVLVQGMIRNAGLDLSISPQLRKSGTELSFTLLYTDAVTNSSSTSSSAEKLTASIRTNLALAARIQIPVEMGVLLMIKSSSSADKRETVAIFELETLKR